MSKVSKVSKISKVTKVSKMLKVSEVTEVTEVSKMSKLFKVVSKVSIVSRGTQEIKKNQVSVCQSVSESVNLWGIEVLTHLKNIGRVNPSRGGLMPPPQENSRVNIVLGCC